MKQNRASVYFLPVFACLYFFLSTLHCQEKEKKGASSQQILLKKGKVTKITQMGRVQFALDLLKKENYQKMLKHMNIPLPPDPVEIQAGGQVYGLLLTLIDLQTGELIEKAQVEIDFLLPNSSEPSAQKIQELHGAGMHHYGVYTRLSSVDGLKVTARVRYREAEYISKAGF